MPDEIINQGGGLIHVLKARDGLGSPKPFQHDIELLVIRVAGTTHVEDIREIEPMLKEGSRVQFFREPGNLYDERAIVLRAQDGRKIGYVPREKNEILSHLLDGGKLLYGVVKAKEWTGNWLRIEVTVFLTDE